MTFPNKAMSEISIPFGFALQFKIYEARLKILGLRITQVVTKYRLVDSSDTNLYDMQTVNPPAGEPSLKHDTLYTVMATEPFPQADFYHGSKVDVVMTVMVTNGTDTVSYESVMPDIVLVTTNVIDLDLPIDHPLAIPKHVNDVLVANLFATGNLFH